jgi:hypothetical protein
LPPAIGKTKRKVGRSRSPTVIFNRTAGAFPPLGGKIHINKFKGTEGLNVGESSALFFPTTHWSESGLLLPSKGCFARG